MQRFTSSSNDHEKLKTAMPSTPLTPEDYIKLLTAKGRHNSNIEPPPLPPKPKLIIDSGTNQQSFKKYTPNTAKFSLSSARDNLTSANSAFEWTRSESGDCPLQSNTYSRDRQDKTSKIFIGDPKVTNKPRTPVGCVIYDSSIDESLGFDNGSRMTTRPIVTESPEEFNNNNIENPAIRQSNTSTVEILEVPYQQRSLGNNNYGNTDSNTTFIRSQKALHSLYESRSYATPVVTAPTDDDESDSPSMPMDVDSNPHKSGIDVLRTSTPTNGKTNTFDDVGSNGPRNPTTIYIANDNIVNKSAIQPSAIDSNGEIYQDDEDIANVSRDTDDMNETSVLNQSGGCELIGVNDTSDQSAQSKPSPAISSDQERIPYTVQIFNDTMMSSSPLSPNTVKKDHLETKTTNHNHSSCDDRIQKLENLTKVLSAEIEQLKSHTSKLSAIIDKLVSRIDSDDIEKDKLVTERSSFDFIKQRLPNLVNVDLREQDKEDSDFNKDNLNDSSDSESTVTHEVHLYNRSIQPQFSTRLQEKLNKTYDYSVPTNKTETSERFISSSIKDLSQTGRFQNISPSNQLPSTKQVPLNSNLNQTATYSRSQTSLSKTPANGRMSKSLHQSSNILTSSANGSSKYTKKSNAHVSTSSLYADGLKPTGPSVSPLPTQHDLSRQSVSPTSHMSLSHRRDPSAYSSMMSLTSLNQSLGSTLKKGSAISGSISNLSQIGSQLSSWPSESNFLSSKHKAKDILYDSIERTIRMVLYNTLITMRLPSWIRNYDLEHIIEPPPTKLKLDWVHGYRGRDCRSNLFYLPTGECIYFVASIVVLYNPDQKSQRHYLGHTDSVKCIAVHPNKLIVASGQSCDSNNKDKRPIVRVWNTVSLATLRVIGFNEDFDRAICCLAFSKHDQGATLAVVDESVDHTITLLDWQREKSWRIAEANSGHDPVLAIDFHPLEKYCLVTVGRSTVNFWDIRGLTLAKKAGLFDKYDKPKYVLCLTFNDFGDTITGDSNGNIIIWPRGTNRPKRIIYEAHQGGVFSVLAMKDGKYLTGGRDRKIIEWDENFNQTGREAELPEHFGGIRYITYGRGPQVLIGTLRNSILIGSLDTSFNQIMQGHAEAISSLAVHPNQPQYLTGGFDDQIHLFDAIEHNVVWSKCIMMPATAAAFSPNGLLLIVGSTSGKWVLIDLITREILFTKCDGSGTISCIKFSPDGKLFCMGSSDSQCYLYQTSDDGNKFCRIGTCVGHSAPIKEIDWSHDSRYLQTQSMNFELLYWKAVNCRPLEDTQIIDDLKFHTQNCTLGFNVIGIWSDHIDSALVNCCDKSNDERILASATDTGNINLFEWPAYTNQCLSRKYYGNAEKFNFIKFLHNDSRLIAVGAKNCLTTEWIIDK